jgi:hypothetical protein
MTWELERDIIAPVSDAEKAAVRRAQRALRLSETGDLDEVTASHLRGVQRLFKLPVTGVLDRATALALGRLSYVPQED